MVLTSFIITWILITLLLLGLIKIIWKWLFQVKLEAKSKSRWIWYGELTNIVTPMVGATLLINIFLWWVIVELFSR